MWIQIRLEHSDQSPHCFPVCKNRFEKFARIFSRRHKQTTVSDAGFLGVLRVHIVNTKSPETCFNKSAVTDHTAMATQCH